MFRGFVRKTVTLERKLIYLPNCHKLHQMKKLFLLFLLSGCTVIIPPKFTPGDLYEENKENLLKSYKVKFIEVTAQDLMESKAKEIVLFANWCGHSYYYISNLTPEQKQGVKFVSSNYAIDNLVNKFALDTIYLLSNKYYGSVQNDKIIRFETELLQAEDSVKGVPQRFVLTDSGYKRIPLYNEQ